MLELMQRMVAFKYSCKLNHWNTDQYAQHLLFDRLQENMDDLVDDVAEQYFMANKKQKELTADVLKKEYINRDLEKGIKDVINLIEEMMNDEKFTEGEQSLLSGLSQEFYAKLALVNLK